MTLDNNEDNLYVWDEDILSSYSLKKEKIYIKKVDNR